MLTRCLLVSLFATVALATTGHPLSYPSASRDPVTTDYHGVKVPDPYRWMENIDSPATRAWVEAEGKLSHDYLDAIPGREAIVQRLRQIWNFERWSSPEHHGHYWFYTHNDGLQNQSVIFATTDPGTPGHVLLDPNTLSKDGTVALRETAVSDDGHLFAYALSDAGSDWQIWHVRNVDTGADLPDEIHWSKAGGGTWRKDAAGFYYTSYDAPKNGDVLKAANQYEKLFFHKLGTPQSEDKLVYTRADDPDWFVGGVVSDDGRYLVIQANHGDEVQNRTCRSPGRRSNRSFQSPRRSSPSSATSARRCMCRLTTARRATRLSRSTRRSPIQPTGERWCRNRRTRWIPQRSSAASW
jgi:prolyl oligopeptidase